MIYKYPVKDPEASVFDVHVIAQQSHRIAETIAYSNITEGQPLSEEYISSAKKAAERQIVVGGFRLAYMIRSFNLEGHQVQPPKPQVQKRTLMARILGDFPTYAGFI